MVRKVGVEPTRYCYHQILSLERLPIPPLSHNGSPSRIRTCDSLINSQVLYRLSYRGILVQMTRFEHATSCSQSSRPTKLSYIWIMMRTQTIKQFSEGFLASLLLLGLCPLVVLGTSPFISTNHKIGMSLRMAAKLILNVLCYILVFRLISRHDRTSFFLA